MSVRKRTVLTRWRRRRNEGIWKELGTEPETDYIKYYQKHCRRLG
jgi:hypothetical protein